MRAANQSLLAGVTDSGKGIPPEILPRILEPFFTTKPAGGGSGAGLDIVKKIVEKHSGKIQSNISYRSKNLYCVNSDRHLAGVALKIIPVRDQKCNSRLMSYQIRLHSQRDC